MAKFSKNPHAVKTLDGQAYRLEGVGSYITHLKLRGGKYLAAGLLQSKKGNSFDAVIPQWAGQRLEQAGCLCMR